MENSIAFAPTCSVVVCTRNRPEVLNRCLEALAQVAYPQFEVLVVDNAPEDSRAQAAAQRWGVGYLVEPVAGLSRARNAGARACSSEIVAFTDDDAVPDREWLSMLAAEFRDPGVTVVTGRILSLFGCSGGYTGDFGPTRISLDRTNPLWFEMACFGGIGDGGNMAFRRRAFDAWSGFDERLGRGTFLSDGEEHRAFAHLIERGCKAVYTPEAVVCHPIPETWEERRAQYLRSLSDLVGFALFLFLVTRHKWKVSRYVIEAALGTTRTWRFQAGKLPPTPVARWRRLLAYLTGLWHCLRACLRTGQRRPDALSATITRKSARTEAGILSVAGK